MNEGQQRWERVQVLCAALDGVPSSDHEAFLEAREPDSGVREEAMALFAASQAEQEASRRLRSEMADVVTLPPTIGNVEITGLLGAGGSGVVYRGVRRVNGVSQPVAVKRLHAHRLGPEHQARFEREQRLLAAVTHPGIVRWLDGGFADGSSYLTMELVEGEPITAYCDRRQLGIGDRLKLMADVSEAVQSAHQHLIVHLDLKPSNILVTDGGQVKLLDFGTAKLMDDTGALTATEQLTPLYASPERLRGGEVSIACDVYSLGLVLFELLAGAWPFAGRESIVAVAERASGDAAFRDPATAVTTEAARARGMSAERLRSLLRGDLAAICAKALAHVPAERYRTVEQLAIDIAAYREGRPVKARRQSHALRASRFVRRHWLATSAAATVLTVLLASVAFSIHERDLARVEAARARAANGFLTGLISSVQWTASGHQATVEEFNYQALAKLNRQVAAGAIHPEMEAPVRLALAHSFTSNADAGSAGEQVRRLFELAELTESPRTRVLALSAQSELWFVQGKLKDAAPPAREAYEIARRLFSDDADLVLSTTAALAARQVAAAGPIPEGLALHRDAVRLARAVRPVDEGGLVTVLSRACAALVEVEPAEGRALCQEAIALSARLPLHGGLHAAYSALGQEAANRGDWAAAVTHRRQALTVVTATAAHSNLVPLASSLLAWAEWMSGLDKPGAEQRAAASARTVSESTPNSAWNYVPYLIHALILNRTGDGPAAEHWIRRAIAVAGYDLDRDPRAALQHMVLAKALLLQGKREEARAQADRGLALAKRTKVAAQFRQGLAEIRAEAEPVLEVAERLSATGRARNSDRRAE